MRHTHRIARSILAAAVLAMCSHADAAVPNHFIASAKFGPAWSPFSANAGVEIGQPPASTGCGSSSSFQAGSRGLQLGCGVSGGLEQSFGTVTATSRPMGNVSGHSPATIDTTSLVPQFDSFGATTSRNARRSTRQSNASVPMNVSRPHDTVDDYLADRHADFGVGGSGQSGGTILAPLGSGATDYAVANYNSPRPSHGNHGTLVVNSTSYSAGSSFSAGAATIFNTIYNNSSSRSGTLVITGNFGGHSLWNTPSAVPEPTTCGLLATACVLLIGRRRRVA